MLRAQVPLQNRNAAFTATQANPNPAPLAQYLTLTGDYGNSFFNSDAYTNEFSTHVFNFWQYVDQYASWHGMPSVGTPEELNDVKDERSATDGNAWKRRNFEFGLVNLPNPACTNAAHKNGVLSLGCMFQPRAYQNFEVMLYKDEAAFNGFEAGRDRWGNNFSRMMKDGVMNGSIASLGTDFVQTGLEKTVRQDEETGYRLFSRELDEYQWMAFERERLWRTGNDNNRTTNVNAGLSGSTNDIAASNFTGVSNYIAERSVVHGDTFYTNFNTGHGLEYKLNGELSSTTEWSNINLQDILPTWQW